MPNVKIKTSHYNQLKELGIYDLWIAEVALQWDSDRCFINPNTKPPISIINSDDKINISFDVFIQLSFAWDTSVMGFDFWDSVSIYKNIFPVVKQV